jgi:hypothetical protein
LVSVGAVTFMVWAWSWPMTVDQRLIAVGDTAGVGALVLAAVAAVIALMAYRAATGLPDLQPRLWNAFSDPGEIMMKVLPVEAPATWPRVENFKQTIINVEIVNVSPWSARNPLIQVELIGIGSFGPRLGEGWRAARHTQTVGVTTVQWDGGADNSIHGQSSRVLPPLDFSDVSQNPHERRPRLVMGMWAEGYRAKAVELPIRFVTDDEWGEIMRHRSEAAFQRAGPHEA